MPEIITFVAPVDAPKSVFRVSMISFDWANSHITIHLREWTGTEFGERTLTAHYTGTVGRTLMTQLNKANLSTAGNSLHQRVMDRLKVDGKIPPGVTSGEPD